jgi:hypothetical protein
MKVKIYRAVAFLLALAIVGSLAVTSVFAEEIPGEPPEAIEETPPHTEHDWTGGAQWVAPTCTKDGYSIVYCGECGAEKREVLPATGHKWAGGAYQIPATCTKDGCTVMFCSVCGKENRQTIKATGHKWKRKIVRKATRKRCGKAIDTCKRCGKKKTVKIPKLPKKHKKHRSHKK